MSKWDKEKESLQKMVDDKIPYTEMAKIYKCSDTNIKKVLKQLGIKLESRKRTFDKDEIKICPICNCEFKPKANRRNDDGLTKTCSKECGWQLNSLNLYEEYKKDNSIAYGRKIYNL